LYSATKPFALERVSVRSHDPPVLQAIVVAGSGVEDLKQDHASRPRNPLIAKAFYMRGLVERWGRGTQRIVELCVGAGHPEPEDRDRLARCACASFLPGTAHRIGSPTT
jgi:ATP-dependent DNA helicase RecG